MAHFGLESQAGTLKVDVPEKCALGMGTGLAQEQASGLD
jgi:hypothetical protein